MIPALLLFLFAGSAQAEGGSLPQRPSFIPHKCVVNGQLTSLRRYNKAKARLEAAALPRSEESYWYVVLAACHRDWLGVEEGLAGTFAPGDLALAWDAAQRFKTDRVVDNLLGSGWTEVRVGGARWTQFTPQANVSVGGNLVGFYVGTGIDFALPQVTSFGEPIADRFSASPGVTHPAFLTDAIIAPMWGWRIEAGAALPINTGRSLPSVLRIAGRMRFNWWDAAGGEFDYGGLTAWEQPLVRDWRRRYPYSCVFVEGGRMTIWDPTPDHSDGSDTHSWWAAVNLGLGMHF